MNFTEEQVAPGIVVSRGAINPEDCEGLRLELDDIWKQKAGETRPYGQTRITYAETLPGFFPNFGPVLTSLIDDLGIPKNSAFSINSYPPLAQGPLHHDGCDVMVLQPTGGGVYDIVPDGSISAESGIIGPYETIEFNAGDVLKSSARYIWHRGRNMTRETRRNIAFFWPDEEPRRR